MDSNFPDHKWRAKGCNKMGVVSTNQIIFRKIWKIIPIEKCIDKLFRLYIFYIYIMIIFIDPWTPPKENCHKLRKKNHCHELNTPKKTDCHELPLPQKMHCFPAKGVDPSVVDVNGRTCLDVPWIGVRKSARETIGANFHGGNSPTVSQMLHVWNICLH